MTERPETSPPREREPKIFHIETAVGGARANYRVAQREETEDHSFVLSSGLAAGVFDGMGGHEGGEIASELASDTVKLNLIKLTDKDTVETATAAITRALQQAHEAVAAKNLKNSAAERTKQMGTTGVATALVEQNGKTTAIIGWVGDSRAILIRSGKATTLTLDDAYWFDKEKVPLAERARQQEIQSTIESAANLPPDAFPKKLIRDAYINQHIGKLEDFDTEFIEATIDVHVTTIELQDGDILLLCSDGITDPIPLPMIAHIASNCTVKDLPQQLINEVDLRIAENSPRRKDDDRTVVAIKTTL